MVISQMTNRSIVNWRNGSFDDSNTAKHWRHPSTNKATMKFIYGYNCIYLHRIILAICFCVFWRVFNIINNYKIIGALRLLDKIRMFFYKYPDMNKLRTYCCEKRVLNNDLSIELQFYFLQLKIITALREIFEFIFMMICKPRRENVRTMV